MYLSGFQWFLILAEIALQIGIVTVMARNKARLAFPYFFQFVGFSLACQILSAAMLPYISSQTYFYMFWITMGARTLLSFVVIYEVFAHILKPYSALVDLGKLLFRWAIVFLALVSAITAFATSGSDLTKICTVIQLLSRCSELMQCGLLLFFVLFESRLGLSWRSPAVCIMLGFGINSSFSLILDLLGDHITSWGYALSLIGAISSLLIYALWCASLALPQPSRRTVQDSPTRLILQRWNEALMASPLMSRKGEVIAMSPIESFLPGVERTVERVMARKMMN